MKIKDRYLLALVLITICGLILRLIMAHIDPFLHDWDERYHALVAKNMMDNPFVPMLRKNAYLAVDPYSWTNGTIWIHKQPLFLWQMAVSMKIFGINEYALRYPSVLMGTAMIPMLYYIALAFVQDKSVALIAAALLALSNFHLELISGIKGMDHNDVALGFYVLASVFAWIKYRERPSWKWMTLIGLFAGCAILNKWLYGLYVFLIWGVYIIANHRTEFNKKHIIHFAVALLVCCIVFVPWQLYISHRFPAQAAFEYEFNRWHITEVLEDHDGSIWYYLGHFPQLFGEGVWLLVFPGLFLFFKLGSTDRKLYIPLLSGMIFLFVFLSFFVRTKVVSHFYFVAPFFFIFIAITLWAILGKLKYRLLKFFFCMLVVILVWKPEKTVFYVWKNEGRKVKIAETISAKQLKEKIGDREVCIIGARNYIELMFFNNAVSAFESIPTEAELSILVKKKIPVMTFSTKKEIPDYLKNSLFFSFIPNS